MLKLKPETALRYTWEAHLVEGVGQLWVYEMLLQLGMMQGLAF